MGGLVLVGCFVIMELVRACIRVTSAKREGEGGDARPVCMQILLKDRYQFYE